MSKDVECLEQALKSVGLTDLTDPDSKQLVNELKNLIIHKKAAKGAIGRNDIMATLRNKQYQKVQHKVRVLEGKAVLDDFDTVKDKLIYLKSIYNSPVSGNNLETKSASILAKFINTVRRPLTLDAPLRKFYTSLMVNSQLKPDRAHHQKVVEALTYLEMGEEIPAYYGAEIIQNTNKLFKIMRKSADQIFWDKNAAGILTGKIENYILPQEIDKAKLADIDLPEFDALIRKRVKWNKGGETALTADQIGDIISDLHQNWATVTGKPQGPSSDPVLALALSEAKSRKIFFNNPVDRIAVMKVLGPENDVPTLLHKHMMKSSRAIANNETLGPEPMQAMAELIEHVRQTTSEEGGLVRTEKGKKVNYGDMIEDMQTDAKEQLDKLLTFRKTPDSWVNDSINFAKAFMVLKLSNVVFTAAPGDLSSRMLGELTQGRGEKNIKDLMASGVQYAQDLVALKSAEDRIKLADLLGVEIASAETYRTNMLLTELHSSRPRMQKGVMIANNLSGKFLEGVGLNLYTNASVPSGMLWGAETFTENIRAFKDGNEHAANNLRAYGLPDKTVNFLVKHLDEIVHDGSEYQRMKGQISPSLIAKLPLKYFGQSDTLSRSTRNQLANTVSTSMRGLGQTSVPQASLISSPTGADTWSRHAWKILLPFKGVLFKMNTIARYSYNQMYERTGSHATPALAMSGAMAVSGLGFLFSDLFRAAITDDKSTVQKILAGDIEESVFDVIEKVSPVPLFTDPMIRTWEGKDKGMFNAFTEAAAGPLVSTAGELAIGLSKSLNRGSVKPLAQPLRNLAPVMDHPVFKGVSGYSPYSWDMRRWRKKSNQRKFLENWE